MKLFGPHRPETVLLRRNTLYVCMQTSVRFTFALSARQAHVIKKRRRKPPDRRVPSLPPHGIEMLLLSSHFDLIHVQ